MGVLVGVAVTSNEHGVLLVKVREVNGHASTEQTDLFKYNLLKEYSTGLTISDIKIFIQWFIQAPPGLLESKGRMQAKLTELKHFRMAFYHVMHPEGRIPKSKSMQTIFTPSRINFSPFLRD